MASGLGLPATNRVYAARYRHLTTRETNKLTPAQAQSAVAAAILRQLHAVVVHQQVWDPHVAGPRLAQVAGACGLTPFTALRL